MAASEAFLAARRTEIEASAEYTAFAAARAALVGSDNADERAAWTACYDDNQAGGSPALRLATEIRALVTAAAGSTLSPSDREAAYRTLTAEYVTAHDEPASPTEQAAFLEQFYLEDQLQ